MADIDNDLHDFNLCLDPRIDIDSKPVYTIEKSGSYVRYYQEEANTGNNTSSISFHLQPPSKDIIVSKKMFISVEARFTLSAPSNAGGSNLLAVDSSGKFAGQHDSLRYMALHAVTESLSITFNQSTVAQNLSQYISQATLAGWMEEFSRRELSQSPCMPDQSQEYADVFATARNPMNPYAFNSNVVPRAGLEYTIQSNTDVEAVIDCRWREPVLLSPLSFGRTDEPGFTGMTQIDVNYNLGDLSRMWSRDEVNGVALDVKPSVEFLRNPRLEVCYITPAMGELPKMERVFDYNQVRFFPKDQGSAIASGASSQANSDSIQISSIPKRMLVFLRERNVDRAYNHTDSMAKIDSISLQWQNENSLLASATDYQLHQLSCMNGLQQSWIQFAKDQGSLMVIDFGRDIGSSALSGVGSYGQYQFNVQVNYTNTSSRAVQYTLMVVLVQEGSLVMVDTVSKLNVGTILPADVHEAELAKSGHCIHYHELQDFQGGSFLKKLRSIAKKTGHVIHKGLELAEKAEPYVRKYGPTVAKGLATVAPILMGLGYNDQQVYEMLKSKYSDKDLKSAGITGGARVSRRSLRDRC